MGTRALKFSRLHPDASPGYAAALSSLEERLTRAEQLADRQRDGITDVRAATEKKRELRKKMRRTQLMHLARVAKATKEVPELAQKFALAPETTAYQTFRTVARGMVAEAQTQKELLVKHGLADTVLDSLVEASTHRALMTHQPAPRPESQHAHDHKASDDSAGLSKRIFYHRQLVPKLKP